jgi:creatinine amidohydrolase/Fe(II)-dependent formamide hydrolase-like protein
MFSNSYLATPEHGEKLFEVAVEAVCKDFEAFLSPALLSSPIPALQE